MSNSSVGHARPRSIAVVGSGVSGLTAAHVLQRSDRVTLYEADHRLGGHAHTHAVPLADGTTMAVDTGFIVHNDRTYPTLQRLFAELAVPTQESDMSMSVRSDHAGLEYAGAKGLAGLFADRRNLYRPRYLRMLGEVTRFHRAARSLLDTPDRGSGETGSDQTLRDFLTHHRFSSYFVEHFMTPLVAAVWSCAPAAAGEYPARYLFTFLEHHGMLSVFGSPTWRTVTGGSAVYVERIAAELDEVLVGARVRRIVRTEDGVQILDSDGAFRYFDAAVVAVHPQHALALLDRPTTLESEVLGAMPYSPNQAILHTDESILPRSKRARASWNYRTPDGGNIGHMTVTYDLTRLMRLGTPDGRRFLVTLGGAGLVDPSSILATMRYEHPLYTPESVAARRRLPELGSPTLAFAGAYHGWGFHEDGALSGLHSAQRIGGSWDVGSRSHITTAAGELA